MNVNKSDASTSTDDIKGRPLCLFYFTHPFGVLSPEPPAVSAAPPPAHIARAFINMEPVSPAFTFWTSSTDHSYDTTGSPGPRDLRHENPVDDIGRRAGGTEPRRDRLSSSLLSSELWFGSGSSYGSGERVRRLIPYNALLPPLRLPRDPPRLDTAGHVRPGRRPNPARLSLPPIQHPALPACPPATELPDAGQGAGQGATRLRRRLGVRKHRRRGFTDVRRMLTCLLRRAVRGCSGAGAVGAAGAPGASPPLRSVVRTVRDAWSERRSLFESQPQRARRSCSRPVNLCERNSTLRRDREVGEVEGGEACEDTMVSAPQALTAGCGGDGGGGGGGETPRPHASPGLLRRRYSVPETIMRKYRVAQQRTDCDQSRSSSRGSTGSGAAPRFGRDRELMRKSALLRRLWGRAPPTPPPYCRYCRDQLAARHSRSLDGSHSELRRSPAELSASSYRSHVRADLRAWDPDVRAASLSDGIASAPADTVLVSAREDSPHSPYVDLLPSPVRSAGTGTGGSASRGSMVHQTSVEGSGCQLSFVPETLPSCETLEVVVTESSQACSRPGRASPPQVRVSPGVNIDEYVSSVLVESLSSLSDRLDLVTSRVPGDGKISVIEKEIKVKLQSTGVNTIVHLSPTSNNQIIFGNEELCDGIVDLRETPRLEPPRAESDDELAPAPPRFGIEVAETFGRHRDVNRAVLRQIQKLFREEIHDLDPAVSHAPGEMSSISHIEISNVSNIGLFLEDSTESLTPRAAAESGLHDPVSHSNPEIVSGIGAGNYFESTQMGAVVPRFTALPHTASMEVNASSEEAELVGSDCTSLVDSLDEPNSPRNVLLRRALTGRRAELVRSAIDVLDLLPGTVTDNENVHTKESEYFYVGIEDKECRCDKENVNVADRMPEIIKQRLYRRHRRRQLRMESARRSRIKNHMQEIQKLGLDDRRRVIDVERDCAAIIDTLVDDVISIIVQDEFRHTRIERRSEHSVAARPVENSSKKNRKKPSRPVGTMSTGPAQTRSSTGSLARGSDNNGNEEYDGQRMQQIRGKLSLLTRPSLSPDDGRPRRVYQKSEIREGNKCIEILEILEYVNDDKISPYTPGTDDCRGFTMRSGKKSRIPVPVNEKTHRQLRSFGKPIPSGDSTSPPTPCICAVETVCARRDNEEPASSPAHRLFLPPAVEARPRSGSVRFRRVFDVIPEERSSFTVESSADDTDRGACSIASSAVPAPAPSTRSVGTSPRAYPPAGPLRVKVGKGGARKARGWAARHEEGTRGKTDSVGHQAARASARLDSLPKNKNLKRIQILANEGAVQRKCNRAQSHSRETIPTAPPPPAYPRSSLGDSPGRPRGADLPNVEQQSRSDEECSSSGESVLCPLAPRWLTAPTRRRRPRNPAPPPDPGEWSVTVAGSCRAALPADVEMRLRFPRCGRRAPRRPARCAAVAAGYQDCTCSARTERSASPSPLPAPRRRPALTLTLKKEARDSSILTSKSRKKSTDLLPDLETYSSSRSRTRSSVKTRRRCSLQCWLPADEPTPQGALPRDALAVSGSAIVPELKPRASTMSERDLTRRRYLRS